jgi:hypothetical protein
MAGWGIWRGRRGKSGRGRARAALTADGVPATFPPHVATASRRSVSPGFRAGGG